MEEETNMIFIRKYKDIMYKNWYTVVNNAKKGNTQNVSNLNKNRFKPYRLVLTDIAD